MDKISDKKALTSKQLRSLLSTFKQTRGAEYGLQALGYFGSYANNKAHANSDVDVVFDTNNPNLFMTSMLKQDLEVFLDKPVDVLRLHSAMNPRLKARIEKEAIYV